MISQSFSRINDLINNFDFFIFDLDDTLYDEKKYLFKAYDNIAIKLSVNNHKQAKEIFNFLKNTFLNEGRHNLFDKLFAKFNIQGFEIEDLLTELRNCKFETKIPLFPEIYFFIEKLIKAKKKLFILTNGNVVQQKNKIANIDWRNFLHFFKIYYANEIEPKPSDKVINVMVQENNIDINKTVLIGDSEVDRLCAENANIPFIHIKELKQIIKTEL